VSVGSKVFKGCKGFKGFGVSRGVEGSVGSKVSEGAKRFEVLEVPGGSKVFKGFKGFGVSRGVKGSVGSKVSKGAKRFEVLKVPVGSKVFKVFKGGVDCSRGFGVACRLILAVEILSDTRFSGRDRNLTVSAAAWEVTGAKIWLLTSGEEVRRLSEVLEVIEDDVVLPGISGVCDEEVGNFGRLRRSSIVQGCLTLQFDKQWGELKVIWYFDQCIQGSC
jgi:hypothetical protein